MGALEKSKADQTVINPETFAVDFDCRKAVEPRKELLSRRENSGTP